MSDIAPAINDGERLSRNAEKIRKRYSSIAKAVASNEYYEAISAITAYVVKVRPPEDAIKNRLIELKPKTIGDAIEAIRFEPWYEGVTYDELQACFTSLH
jgi:hypothetical protein